MLWIMLLSKLNMDPVELRMKNLLREGDPLVTGIFIAPSFVLYLLGPIVEALVNCKSWCGE